MTYPGNVTLAEEIRERILNTFRQTLDLASQGSLREAELGCDFVLRLDPQFEPARTLQGRIAGEDAPLDVEDLRQLVSGDPQPLDLEPFDTVVTDQASDDAGADSGDDTIVLDLDSDPSNDLEVFLSGGAATAATSSGALPPRTEPEPERGIDDSLAEALDLSGLENPEAAAPADSPLPDLGAAPSEPVAALDSESEQRVDDLLQEGQAAFDRSEYQAAIDAWSRIFLIDIDHAEANRRIELARKLKAEVERKVEEAFHDAIRQVETGQLDDAKAGFESVLRMTPGHVAAQEYLDRLNAPDFAPAEQPAGLPGPESLPGLPEEVLGSQDGADIFPGKADFSGAPGEMPGAPAAEGLPSPPGSGAGSATAGAPNRKLVTFGALGLLLLLAGGWFVYQNWSTFFPNATDGAIEPVRLDPVQRAKKTYAEAGAAIAIAQLKRMPSNHPQYAEAQALVAQWEAALDAATPDVEVPNPQFAAARDELVARARVAFGQQKFLLSRQLLRQAEERAALSKEGSIMVTEVESLLEPIRTEVEMFEQGEWEMALRNLWRTWESGARTPDIQRLMTDSYFNLGVRDLQRGDVAAAVTNLNEAKGFARSDGELDRIVDFAATYDGQPQDLLYRIFVKYLPFR